MSLDGVDKGGLNWPINVDGNWRQELTSFRNEIKGLKSDLDAIKGAKVSVSKSSGGKGRVSQAQTENSLLEKLHNEQLKKKLSREETALQQQQAMYEKAAKKQAETYRKEYQGFLKEQERLNREISKAKERTAVAEQRREEKANQQRLLNQRQDAIEAQREADRAYKASAQGRADAIVAAAKKQQEVEKLLQSRGFDSRGVPLERETLTNRIRNFLGLAKATDGAEKAGSRFLFTFRRLFGVLAFFTIVRNVTNSFLQMVKSMVTVNAELETMRLGMASLFVSVGQVRDITGGVVSPMQGLSLSLKEAQRQMQLLRKDSLQTTASFDKLAETFQVAIAPGMSAGMSLDQIRTFSVRISQAADAIGLSQNQLAEEIRSILGGTIQARTTRIAVALGITNEDIRNARAAGTLVDFLQKKFSAFALAGEEAMGTFNGILNRVRNGFILLLQEGGLEFFETVKDAMKDVFGLLVQVNRETGNLEPNPKAVAIIRALADGLSAGVVAAKAFVSSLRFEDVLEIAQAVGNVIGALPRMVGSFISGFVRGLSSVLNILRNIISLIRGITLGLFDTKNLNETLELVGKLVAYFIALRAATGVFAAISSGAGLAGAAIIGFVFAAEKLTKVLDNVTGAKVQLDWGQRFRIVANDISAAMEAAALIQSQGLFAAKNTPDLEGQLADIENQRVQKLREIMGLTEDASEEQKNQVDAVELLKRSMEELPGIISQSRRPLSENAQVITRIRSELDKVNGDLRAQASTQGLSGTPMELLRETADSYQLFVEEQRRLNDELQENEKQRENLLRDMVSVGSQFSRLTSEQRAVASTLISSYSATVKLDKQRFDILSQISSLQEESSDLKEGDPRLREIDSEVAGLQLKLRLTADKIEKEKASRELSIQGVDNAAAAVDAAKEHLRVQGLLKTNEENRLSIEQDRAELDRGRVRILQEQLRLIAEKGRFEAEQQNRILQAENEGTRAIRSRQERDRALIASGQAPGEAGLALTELQAQYGLEAEQFRLREETRRRNLQALDQEIETMVEVDSSLQSIQAMEAYRVELIRQQGLERERELDTLKQQEIELRRLRFIAEQPIQAGVATAMQEMVLQWTDSFQIAAELTRNSVEELASFISSAISDAFDPNKKVDLKERFGQFLKSIADMMIQMLVKLALIKSLMNIGLFGGMPIAIAAHDGGSVNDKFRKARGYAKGGRPSGLHPSDRIPIWTAPGEWVVRANSVKKYGDRVMSAINQGLVDPFQLRTLAGVGAGRIPSSGPGFAEGGKIGSLSTSTDSSKPGYQQAVLVADEGTNDKLMAGGKNSFMRMISRNASEFRTAMGLR